MSDLSKVTSSCYCGAVKIQYSVKDDNLILSFICHCTDDRKITSSVFASNFAVKKDTMIYLKGEDNITVYERKTGIASGDQMDNHFCKTCGSLLFRVSSGFPGALVLRLGAVDDFSLHEGYLKPQVEQFVKDKVTWLEPAKGVAQDDGNPITPDGTWQQYARGDESST